MTRDQSKRERLRDEIAALFRHAPGEERPGDKTPGEIADLVLDAIWHELDERLYATAQETIRHKDRAIAELTAEVERLRDAYEVRPGESWTVAVTVPMSLSAGMRHDLFTVISRAVGVWEPDDRDGWDADVTGYPTADPPAAECSCGKSYETYGGPEPDCPVHGAVRALNEAQAAIERVRDHCRRKAEWVELHCPDLGVPAEALVNVDEILALLSPAEEGKSLLSSSARTDDETITVTRETLVDAFARIRLEHVHLVDGEAFISADSMADAIFTAVREEKEDPSSLGGAS